MKKIIATSGLLAYILYFNSTGAIAAAMPEIVATDVVQGPKYHQNSTSRFERLTHKLGIDPAEFAKDLALGKSPKEIMKKYSITKNQFRELIK